MAQNTFKLTEQNYQYLFDNASDAIWVHDLEGNILVANKACEKLTGYPRQELVGMNVVNFLSPEFLDTAREVRHKLLSGEAIEQPYEQRMIRKDGTVATLKMATSPLIVDGSVKGFQIVARDVTEEKSTEEMLSKITNGSPIATFVIDKQHRIIHWNTAVESLSGLSYKELAGTDRQWQAFYTEKRPTMADLIVDGASENQIKAYYQDKYRRSDLINGAYECEDFFPDLGRDGKWLHFTASPIKNEAGEIIGALETLQDITEQKRLQENMSYYIQQITRAQEDERKRISRELHDDAAPLLILLLQRLDSVASRPRSKLPESLKTELEDLRRQALEALEDVRRCAQDLRPRILDDLGLIPALEWMAENLGKNYGIDTRVEIGGTERTLPAEVQLLLFRIAQEALSNIRRHSGASVAAVKLEFERNKVRLTISDNGKGFEMANHIEGLASNGKLGIIGMHERARLLGGNLKIQSEPGKGTQVIAEAPLPE